MWIARNRNGSLHLYDDKPIRGINVWYVLLTDCGLSHEFPLNPNLFPEITWEDDEPREIILK